MAEFVRPLFLVPQLLGIGVRDDSAALADGDDRTATPLARALMALFEQLGPLLVDLNLAGYEVIEIVAAPDAASPTVRFDVATLVATSDGPVWGEVGEGGEVYADIDPGWGGGAAAVAFHVEPRLALGWGTGFRSSYGVALGPLPTGWSPNPLPADWADAGGWIAASLPAGTTVPDGIGDALGKVTGNGPLGLLAAHVRDALVGAWNGAANTAARLRDAGLLGLFDPEAWAFAPGAVHRTELRTVFDEKVLADRNGAATPIVQLLDQPLAWIIESHRGAGSADAALDGLRAVLGRELDRMFGAGPGRADARFRLDEWGPRVAGHRQAAVELMVLMEYDLLSLKARVTGEEPLPAVIETERTGAPLTGFYYRNDFTPLTGVSLGQFGVRPATPAGDLDSDDLAAVDDYVEQLRTSSETMVLNQAGDRIAGYWQQRVHRFAADDHRMRIVQWRFEGTRDRSQPGIVYDVSWDGDPTVTSLSFVSSGPYVTVTFFWQGIPYEMERQVNEVVEFDENDQGTVVDRASIKPHISPEQIETLATEETRFDAEVANLAWLHPNEVDYVDAVVEAMVLRVEAYQTASGVEEVAITSTMCNEFNAATEYFDMRHHDAPLGAAARDCVRARLSRADDGIARWAPVLEMIRPGAWPEFVERLDIRPGELKNAGVNNYQWKMRSLPLSAGGARSVKGLVGNALKKGGREALRGIAPAGARIVGALDGTESPVDVTWEPIEVLFKKTGGQADTDWPTMRVDDPDTATDESEKGAVKYYGVVYGASIGAQIGLNLSFDTDWSDLETGFTIWKPDDFAGAFRTKGVDWGFVTTGFVVMNKARREFLGWGPIRTSGSYGYAVFDDIDDDGDERYAWSISHSFTHNTGEYLDLSWAHLYGHICRGDDPFDLEMWSACIDKAEKAIEPSAPPTQTAVLGDAEVPGFETGRSELTADGEAVLRQFATENLAMLMAGHVFMKVEGHASPIGTPRFNHALSYHRARNMVRYLRSYLGITFNIWPGHIAVVPYGELLANEAGAAQDDPEWRRVDVYLNDWYMLRLPTEEPG